MKLTNTSPYPTEVVRRLVSWVASWREVRLDEVRVTGCSAPFRGRAWGGTRRILIRIGRDQAVLHQYPGLSTAPNYMTNDWQETFVVVAAHESQHIRQGLSGARYSEVEAEQVAQACLVEFRVRRAEVLGPVEQRVEIRQAALRQPETRQQVEARKIELLEERVAVWRTKLKRAQTWLKKYERKLKLARAQEQSDGS
jgi:hypothetical protein